MPLELPVVLLVLLAAAMHASWNALVKAGSDRLLTHALVMTVGALLALLVIPFVPVPDRTSWPFLLLSMVAHCGYFGFMLLAYKHGDLSQVYPIARGIAPLIVSGLAVLFVGERLGMQEMLGVLLVTIGIASIAYTGGRDRRNGRALVYAAVTGLFISSYTLVDGMGVRRAGTDLGFIAWLFLLNAVPFGLFVLARRGRSIPGFLRREWRPGVVGGLLATVGYGIIIWAMHTGALARVISLRETSVIIAALIGSHLLKEASGASRLTAAAAVAAGNLLLNLA